jgi:hypothetical protein
MMHRGLENQKHSTEQQNGSLPSASIDCFVCNESSTFPAAATASVKADGKCFVKARFAYGDTEVEPGDVVTATQSAKNVDVCLSAECIAKKKASFRTFSTGRDVLSESLPTASLHVRESSRILQEKCQMFACRINQLESELQINVELHRVMKSDLKAECDRMRSERDSMVIDLGKRILDSFELNVRRNDSWTDVGHVESSADRPTLFPAGDNCAERQNLRLNLHKNSCMCMSGHSKEMDNNKALPAHGNEGNDIEPSDDMKNKNACKDDIIEESETRSTAHDFENKLKEVKADFTNKSVCTFCAMYSECVHEYLANDDHDRNILLHQLLAELASALQDKSEYSEKLYSENTALELRVAQLESSLLQRSSFSSRSIHGELFEECSRLRWRVLELEKNTKLSSEKILLEASVLDDIHCSVEISADPASPFSVIPSTRKRGYKIRKSINCLQCSSPTPSSHSSPAPSSSSSFTTPSAAPSSVQGVWSYECEDNAHDGAAPFTEHNTPTHCHNHGHSESASTSEASSHREIEAILKIQSELQGKLSSLVLDQEMNSQKNVDQKLEQQIRRSKLKLKVELREKINLKEKIAVQLESEEKEKEQIENEISNCVQIDYLMEKVNQLMHLHDAKESDYRALVRDLEEQVHTLSYQLYFAQGSTQERLSDSEVFDPSKGFEGECCGGYQYQDRGKDPYPKESEGSVEGGDGGSSSSNNSHSSRGYAGRDPCLVSTDSRDFTDLEHCTNSTGRIRCSHSPSPCSYNTLLCSTSFSSTTTSPAASSANSSPCKRLCEGASVRDELSSIGLAERSGKMKRN